ncbi:nitroreductase family deazaflavin-dependent oxidoreductase [Ktedonobacter robiniae]|uniref:Nitroreductase family deazaflavin-dependent oxidoreductase n=1 Tax=Ktedonobacter robiniae TaxID=2778365 RepID=A0ABQ3V3F3_9CHLR|nr:nitroreductase family deazaflavin-dependent oxidoreductase [Ktedonobacter robiniae]GHO59488.1 hypothetical protein KSB_79630 [Ktedonobacter robiniae]
MTVYIRDTHPPRGFARILWRLPLWLYRLHLGWLLQSRFLLLTHIGRKSGLPRTTVLEVIRADKTAGKYTVFSGWRKQSDWVKNVEKTPQVKIQIGNHSFHAQTTRPAPEEAEALLLAYAARYPHLLRLVLRLLGYQTDGTEEDLRAIAHHSIMVTFEVLPPGTGGNV